MPINLQHHEHSQKNPNVDWKVKNTKIPNTKKYQNRSKIPRPKKMPKLSCRYHCWNILNFSIMPAHFQKDKEVAIHDHYSRTRVVVFTGGFLFFALVRPSDWEFIEQTAGTPEMRDSSTCWKISSDSKLLVRKRLFLDSSTLSGFSESPKILKKGENVFTCVHLSFSG